jgi:hypothetical protein
MARLKEDRKQAVGSYALVHCIFFIPHQHIPPQNVSNPSTYLVHPSNSFLIAPKAIPPDINQSVHNAGIQQQKEEKHPKPFESPPRFFNSRLPPRQV